MLKFMYTHLKEKQATKDETTIKDNLKKSLALYS